MFVVLGSQHDLDFLFLNSEPSNDERGGVLSLVSIGLVADAM